MYIYNTHSIWHITYSRTPTFGGFWLFAVLLFSKDQRILYESRKRVFSLPTITHTHAGRVPGVGWVSVWVRHYSFIHKLCCCCLGMLLLFFFFFPNSVLFCKHTQTHAHTWTEAHTRIHLHLGSCVTHTYAPWAKRALALSRWIECIGISSSGIVSVSVKLFCRHFISHESKEREKERERKVYLCEYKTQRWESLSVDFIRTFNAAQNHSTEIFF